MHRTHTYVQNLTTQASDVPTSRDITGAPKFKMGHVTVTTPLLIFVVRM